MTAVLYKVYCYRGSDKQIWFEVEDRATGQGVAVCLGGANLERYGDPADGTALAERVDDAQHHRHAGDGRPAFLANPGGLGDRIFAAPLARQDQGGEGPAVFRVEPAGHVSSFSYTR